jgi:hypothetical protein
MKTRRTRRKVEACRALRKQRSTLTDAPKYGRNGGFLKCNS